MALNSTISPRTTLSSLPPEILVLVLTYSQEANLIHTCRHLWKSLPSFVNWTRALCAISLCLTEIKQPELAQYSPFEMAMREYRSEIGLKLSTPLELDQIRAAVFTSCWFTKSHLQRTISSLLRLIALEERRVLYDRTVFRCQRVYNGSGAPILIGNRHIAVRLYRFREYGVVVSVTHGRTRSPVVLNVWHSNAETIIPSAITAVPAARNWPSADSMYYMNIRFLWGDTTGDGFTTSEDTARDAVVSGILQNDAADLSEIMRYLPGPRQGAEWTHVVLAANMGRLEILKVLLNRPVWPAWEIYDLRELADKVKESKTEGWAEIYRLLAYEWRMQRSHEQFSHQKVMR